MKSQLQQYVQKFKSNPQNERLVAEARAGRLLSERLRELREEASLTQKELADRLGRPQSFIAKLELGGYDRCNISTLTTVARAMGYAVNFDRMFVAAKTAVYSGEVDHGDNPDIVQIELHAAASLRRKRPISAHYKRSQLIVLADAKPAAPELVAV